MRIATLTTTRGDRRIFSDFARVQVELQTVDPSFVYIIDSPPHNTEFDLVTRVKKGIEMARNDGVEYIVIIEDDDCYPSNYIETLLPHLTVDFVGFESTLYYNVRNKTWLHQTHPKRSSLFCTAFRVAAMDDFIWPADHYLWLDMRMWEHAREKRKTIKFLQPNRCIGIKHGVGLCAGKSHKRVLENADRDMSFLRSLVEAYQFEFYSKLKL